MSATPESHPDYEARIGAYDRLLAVVDTINQQKGDSEQITEVNAILALIDKLPDVRQGRARDTCLAYADMRIHGLPYRASRPSILIVALSSKECCRSMSPSVIELPMSDCLYYSLIFLVILRCVCRLSCFATQAAFSQLDLCMADEHFQQPKCIQGQDQYRAYPCARRRTYVSLLPLLPLLLPIFVTSTIVTHK